MACFPVYPFTAALLWFSIFNSFSVSSSDPESCAAVRSEYHRQGFKDTVPEFPITADDLKVCVGDGSTHNQLTCCTPIMEHKLGVQSREEFDTRLKKLLNPFANLLAKKHKKFDELFVNVLTFSQQSFHTMFETTYGIMYTQNAYIFNDLFASFDNYYKNGDKDVRAEMDVFFRNLYKKMFTVYNSQYVFSESYLKCVNEHMTGLKPFGADPEKLTTSMKRSLVAFRTFVQGISTAASVVRKVFSVNPNTACLRALMRMSHCSTCSGHQGSKPCLPYCLHVQQLCLVHHQPIAKQWEEFVDAMQNLGERLEGPFNLGHELPPINLKISNAIMNFQEAGIEISNKVFQGCGQPHLGRVVRSATNRGELKFESLDFSSRKEEDNALREREEAMVGLIREIKTKIRNSRHFWSELPSEMCKEARHHGAANCWTGSGLGKYDGAPLVNNSSSAPNPQMDEQVFRLKMITNKLIDAFRGRDVSWMDEDWLGEKSKADTQDDEGFEGSGSGWDRVGLAPQDNKQAGHRDSRYPVDDEDGDGDGYTQHGGEGSGAGSDEDNMEGSGVGYDRGYRENIHGRANNPPPVNPYDMPEVGAHPPTRKRPPPPEKGLENPSAAPAEKPMTLTWAVAVYLLPAVFTFLGTIG